MIATKERTILPLPPMEPGILVNRLWPRGIKKEKAHVEKRMRELGPSDETAEIFCA